MSIRAVKSIKEAIRTMEGAGVELYRAFGFSDPTELDPFLLFDDFRNDIPESFEKGFPWHPHRGIETITYVLEGNVDHADSLGNSGSLGAGDIQWMTSGSGILHQEMPKGNLKGQMHGFQLWANLPSEYKMTDVYCAHRNGIKSSYLKAAGDTGNMIARHNMRLVYGAGDVGLMGEVANSAQSGKAPV